MDRQSLAATHVYPRDGEDNLLTTQLQLERFIMDFRLDNNFIYRDQLKENVLLKKYYCDININDLINYNEELAHRLVSEPAEIVPLFEAALRKCSQKILFTQQGKVELPEHQLLLHSDAEETPIRNLDSMTIARLVRVPGIVIGASVMSSKANKLAVQCRQCRHTQTIPVLGGFSGVQLPRRCGRDKIPNEPEPPCPLDPYFVVHELSQFSDQQVIKLQEAPDQVPVGELPRHVLISADRYLTNRVVPGSRCTVTGIFSIYQNKGSKKSSTSGAVAIRTPYLRAVGIQTDLDQTAKGMAVFSEEEEQEFLELSRKPDLYNIMADCIAPSIYGNRDIKKAILCLLLGGSKKILPDGMKLRGDINVLLLGDPGTAKSQLLKFVERVAPISIYTSGKGSSAAGLTASVQRDQSTREFYLEGGAMVLADGGVVCIDEFDKMRDEDRVAIHEAMEQQTISISKAGIVTTLQARCGVIAAANPIGGRYNSTRPFSANVELTEPILSRFDLLCVVRDTVDPEEDERLARFIVGSHSRSHPEKDDSQPETQESQAQEKQGEIPQELLRKYILYARERCTPKLYHMDEDKVARLFSDMRRESLATGAYPITVRHLEAIIRISEAFCRMRLSEYCSAQDIDRAIAVTIESFVGSQKISAKKALARTFAKYTLPRPGKRRQGQRGATTVMG